MAGTALHMAGAVVMRAVAGERRLSSRILAVLRAVLLPVRADATAYRMRTLLGFRHKLPPNLLLSDNRPPLPSCFEGVAKSPRNLAHLGLNESFQAGAFGVISRGSETSMGPRGQTSASVVRFRAGMLPQSLTIRVNQWDAD